MEELSDSEQAKGIVNQGFTVEFSSEDETSVSDVDTNKNPSSKIKSESQINLTDSANPTSSSKFYELPQNTSSFSPDGRRSESVSSQPVSEKTAVQNLTSAAAIVKIPSSVSRTEENVQTDSSAVSSSPRTSMVSTDTATALPSQISSGNSIPNNSSIIKKPSLVDADSSGYYRNSIPTKEYLTDVRLSQKSSNGLPFHANNNGKGDSTTQHNSTLDDPDNEDSDSLCGQRALNKYKFIFNYTVERPLYCFALWALFYIYWGEEALPGGTFFALAALEILALCLGYVAELIQLPALLGYVAAGLILQNVPRIDVAKDLDTTLTGSIRGTSVVILLIKGGLGFNPVNIVKFKNVIPPLVLGSCVLEAIAATLAVYFILDFPLEWASLMGCIMAAMSGAAVLPYLVSTEQSLSAKTDPFFISTNCQRVITIAKSACGLDAMIAICMAEVALGFIFGEGNVGDSVLKGVVEQLLGAAFGIVWGFCAAYLLDETSSNEKRVLAVFAGGTMSLLGCGKIGYPRGGPIAAFLGTVIVSTVWKKKQVGALEKMGASFTLIWFIFQPLLFAIIGARTNFDLVNWSVVGKGMACLVISQLVRIIVSFSMTSWGSLELKERIFISLAWIPKGTVQAALAPAALDTAMGIKGLKSPEQYYELGNKVMNIAVATFIAASLVGCICLRFIAPRLLYKSK